MTLILRLAKAADLWTARLCRALLAALFLAQIAVVALRYLFAVGFIELQNFVTYAFAALCVLVIPLALRSDAHVRVDIFREAMGPATRRRWDIAAIVLLLGPVFGYTLWASLPMVAYSWSILEGSRDIGGLPGYFLVLTALPVSCALLLLQGAAILIDRSILHDGDALHSDAPPKPEAD